MQEGTPLGQVAGPLPGLCPVSTDVHRLADKVAKLETAQHELDAIRATLLLNFTDRNKSFYLAELNQELSTHQMFHFVLNKLTGN